MWPEALANSTPHLYPELEKSGPCQMFLGEIRGGGHRLWETVTRSGLTQLLHPLRGPSNLEARASSPAKTFQEGKLIPLPVGKAILGSFLGDRAGWVGGGKSTFPLDRRSTVLGSLDPGP